MNTGPVVRPWDSRVEVESGSGRAARACVSPHEVVSALASSGAGQVEAIWPFRLRVVESETASCR